MGVLDAEPSAAQAGAALALFSKFPEHSFKRAIALGCWSPLPKPTVRIGYHNHLCLPDDRVKRQLCVPISLIGLDP
jgi:hypothetical protein